MGTEQSMGLCEQCGRYGPVFTAIHWSGGHGLVNLTLCDGDDDGCELEWLAQLGAADATRAKTPAVTR